ncbi:MAG: 50S ribosomal protein L9, partial [Pseudomonadota bacterium]|nr:50S ribosomal protein L9 [Pseudomonadota bacterium]
AGGFNANRNQIVLKAPIKSLGLHEVPVHLHPEIEAPITVNVARSAAEAERQAKGEAINAVEEATMDDLGLEVGAALAAAGGSLGDR